MKEKLKDKLLGNYTPSNNKQRSLIILLIWLLFIGLVIAFINYSSNTYEQEMPKEEKITYLSLKEIFDKYSNNYKYDITILENNAFIYYKGSLINNVNEGTKIKDGISLNYQITSNIINKDTNEEITNLYENYLYYFFNPNNIYEYISYLKGEEEINGDLKTYNYNYKYNDLDINIQLTTGIDDIKEIIINYDSIKYNIKYNL